MNTPFWKYRFSILWAIVILILCGLPSSDFPKVRFFQIPHFDKLVHFGLYFIFTLIILSESRKSKFFIEISTTIKIVAFTVAILYGISIEIMQWLFFTSRSAEFFDVMANMLGATLSIFTYKYINRLSHGLI